MLKLQSYQKKNNLCIDNNIISVANYFCKNHNYMHSKGLNFTYIPKIQKEKNVLDCIRTSCLYPTSAHRLLAELNYLQDFVGLQSDVLINSSSSKVEFVNFIKESIESNFPVCVFLDTYWVPWHVKYYQKIHMPHSFLVTAVNDNAKYLLCIDGVLSNEVVKLPFKNLFLCTNIMTLKPVNPRINLSFYNIILHIIDLLKNNDKLYNCDCIRIFSEDIRKISFSEDEKSVYEDLNISPFMFGLKSIEYGRKNIADMFAYMSGQFPSQSKNLLSLNLRIHFIAKQWEMVIVNFIKGFYSDQTSFYMNKTADLLLAIADHEESVTRTLLNFI